MAMPPKQEQAEVPVLVGRRSTRISVAVPISLKGVDASGNSFEEHTFTLNVNKHGAEIATSHTLAPDAEITITNSSLGRHARARVVQRRERRTPNSPYEVSVELLEAGNVWGVRFPPADWNKDAKTSGAAAVPEPRPAPPAPTPLPEAAAEPALNGAPAVEPAPAAAQSPQASSAALVPPADETAVETAAPLIANQAAPESRPEMLPAAAQAEAASQPAKIEPRAPAAELAQEVETGKSARISEEHLESLVKRIEEAAARLESSITQAGEARGALESAAERVRSEIELAGQQASHAAVEDFRGKLTQEWEAASSRLLEGARQRLQEDVSAAVAAFGKESGAHLARLTKESGPELEARQKQAVGLAKEQIAYAGEAALGEFGAKLNKSAEEAVASRLTHLKASLDELVSESVSHFGESLREQSESLLKAKAGPLAELRKQMHNEANISSAKFKEACARDVEEARAAIKVETIQAITSLTGAAADANAGLWESSKAIKHDVTFKAEKVRNQLAEVSSAYEEGFKNYLQVQVKGAQEEAQGQLRALAAKCAQDFAEQLQKQADAQLESFGPQLQSQAEDAVVLCKGSLEVIARDSLAEARRQAATVLRESLEAFSGEMRSLEEQFHSQLRKTLEELRAAGRQDLQTHLHQASQDVERAAISRIQAESKAAGDRTVADIKNRAEAAARQVSDAVYKQVGMATVVLKDWGDQAALRLESQFRQSMTAFERQVQELSQRSIEANRLHADSTTEEIRRRLEEATRILRGEVRTPSQENPSADEPSKSSS